MSAIINGSSPSVTFSDGTTQATSAIVSGYVPYANLPAGSVLQVVNATYSSQVSSSSSTFADTNLSATITPKFSTSKILVLVDINGVYKQSNNINVMTRLIRNSTAIVLIDDVAGYNGTSTSNGVGAVSITYLDSPATTSATTYKTQFASDGNAGVVIVNNTNNITNGSTSTITLMEIAQ